MKHQIEIPRFNQTVLNSCTVCACQSILYFFGVLLNTQKACDFFNLTNDGLTIKECLVKISKKYKIRHKRLKSAWQIQNWINKGLPVISGDDGYFDVPHSIVIKGFDSQYFYVNDSKIKKGRKIVKEELIENSDEIFGVFR